MTNKYYQMQEGRVNDDIHLPSHVVIIRSDGKTNDNRWHVHRVPSRPSASGFSMLTLRASHRARTKTTLQDAHRRIAPLDTDTHSDVLILSIVMADVPLSTTMFLEVGRGEWRVRLPDDMRHIIFQRHGGKGQST
jgi:hypothetical protein